MTPKFLYQFFTPHSFQFGNDFTLAMEIMAGNHNKTRLISNQPFTYLLRREKFIVLALSLVAECKAESTE